MNLWILIWESINQKRIWTFFFQNQSLILFFGVSYWQKWSKSRSNSLQYCNYNKFCWKYCSQISKNSSMGRRWPEYSTRSCVHSSILFSGPHPGPKFDNPFPVVEVSGIKVGILICYDLEFCEPARNGIGNVFFVNSTGITDTSS